MMQKMARRKTPRTVEARTHEEASRKNIPTAEFRSVMDRSEQSPVQVAYERRNRDLDPQLVWRGKDAQDWSDLVVQALPLFIQEKGHPKVPIDDLRRQRGNGPVEQAGDGAEVQPDLFADFNGLPSDDARTEFYQHDANWSNRMILGDSLKVMASLAEREGLRGKVHRLWWEARIARQQEIDASIAARADWEYLYDNPYEDNRKVRVAGPFTVESLSPHRMLAVDENDELIDRAAEPRADYGPQQDFAGMILEQLATAGVQQAHKEDRIAFGALTPWPGEYICAEGRYRESDGDAGPEKRAGIFVGPEFGTVARPDLVAAAREAGDAGFDVLVACAFNYEAHASEFKRLGRIPVLKARMNADLHMAGELKNTGKGNLFVVFGEPDIDILQIDEEAAGSKRLQVKINGVDVFHPTTGEVRSDGADGIACWFIDTDYNEESFFVRHAYFLGANDPYKALKTTLKAEIDADAWASLHSDISRPFDRPESGRIAVKVINHLGDEVMKVFRV